MTLRTIYQKSVIRFVPQKTFAMVHSLHSSVRCTVKSSDHKAINSWSLNNWITYQISSRLCNLIFFPLHTRHKTDQWNNRLWWPLLAFVCEFHHTVLVFGQPELVQKGWAPLEPAWHQLQIMLKRSQSGCSTDSKGNTNKRWPAYSLGYAS